MLWRFSIPALRRPQALQEYLKGDQSKAADTGSRGFEAMQDWIRAHAEAGKPLLGDQRQPFRQRHQQSPALLAIPISSGGPHEPL